MVWGSEPDYGHFGLDLTGANGGIIRIDDFEIEDVTHLFHPDTFNVVDLRDYGGVGDGTTDNYNAFVNVDRALMVACCWFRKAHITLAKVSRLLCPCNFVGH